ncbi:hypothetical protein LIER_26349 [Lithospermum erythrorhizon]|uniref:Gag-pol polyprotein n=1 Tax=Lithospermum erythrorhizon TaxID=34254 RepID=A0AAV3R819_LITER
MCTDFTSLNKGLLDEGDHEKTTFITDYGLYCWRVMPFGLKNVGATYQRMVNTIFKDQIGKNMEIYVVDMLVKRNIPWGPSQQLGRIIWEVEEICSKADQPTGRIEPFYFQIGLSKSAFFKKLHHASKEEFISDSQCDTTFEELKSYMGSPKLLTRAEGGEELQLYLAVLEGASGRLTTWAIELIEFEINYAPQAGIKVQVIADFIVENSTCSIPEAPDQDKKSEEVPKWILSMEPAMTKGLEQVF